MVVSNDLCRMVRKTLWFISIAVIWCSCQPKTEVVEAQNEFGRRIRFERRKSDFAKEGKFERFDENDKLVETAEYQNDTLHGIQRLYYPNGQVDMEQSFDHGINHGPYKKYFENGTLQITYNYVNGAIEGESIRYYPNGKVMEVVTLVHSEENGPFKEYYDTGVLKAEGNYIFADDAAAENGELREYDSTGVLIRIANCEQGICRTQWRKE